MKKYTYNYNKKCIQCGMEYVATSTNSTVCSEGCRSIRLKANKTHRLNEEQKALLIKLKLEGKTRAEMMVITGLAEATVKKWTKGIRLTPEHLAANRKKASDSRRREVVDGSIRCGSCKELKSLNQFYEDKNNVNRVASSCKSCQKSYYINNLAKILEDRKEYNKTHKKEIQERNQRYYLLFREKYIEKAEEWRKANPDKSLLIQQKRREGVEYRKEKKARVAAYRAKLAAATPINQSKEEKKSIIEFYKKCPKHYQVDHIIPLEEGGLHILSNLAYVHKNANAAKGRSPSYLFKCSSVGICHQKIVRDRLEIEDRNNGMPFNLKASDFLLQVESLSDEHRKFIERYEWLGSIGYTPKYVFTSRYNGLLAGVIMINEPNRYTKDIPFELQAQVQRGAVASWGPKNLNSRLLMFAVNWMTKNTSKRFFYGYSDPTANEIGTIYQACNFDYLGHFWGSGFIYKDDSGKKFSHQTATNSAAIKKTAKELGIDIPKEWLKPNGYIDRRAIDKDLLKVIKDYIRLKLDMMEKEYVPPKGKYVLMTFSNKKEKAKLHKYKTWLSEPYPKRAIKTQGEE